MTACKTNKGRISSRNWEDSRGSIQICAMSTGSERFIFLSTVCGAGAGTAAHAPAEQATRRFLLELLVLHTKDNTVVVEIETKREIR